MSGLGKKVDGSAAPKGEKVSSGDLELKAASLKPRHSAKKGKAKKPSVTLHSFFGKAGPAAKKAGGAKPNASMGKASKSAASKAGNSSKGGKAKGKEEVTYKEVRETDVVLYGLAKKGFGSKALRDRLDAGAAAVQAINGCTDKAKEDRLAHIKVAIADCRDAGNHKVRFLGKGSTKDTLKVISDEKAIIDAVRTRFKGKKSKDNATIKHDKARKIGQPKGADIVLAVGTTVDRLQDALELKYSAYQELDDLDEKRALVESVVSSFADKGQKIFVLDKHDAAGEPVYVQPGEAELIVICQKRLGWMRYNRKISADREGKQGRRTWTAFSAEEDALIAAFAHEHREKPAIPFDLLELPGRETRSVRNHFNMYLKYRVGPDGKLGATLRCVDFAQAEDALIVAHAQKAESKNEAYCWPVLAESMPGRTPGQLTARYNDWLKRCIDEDGVFDPDQLENLPSLYSLIRESSDHCQKYIASYSNDIKKLKPGDEGRSILAAGFGGCHEHQLKPIRPSVGYVNGNYNLNGSNSKGPAFHVAACTIKWGPASMAELEGRYTKLNDDDLSIVTASHICQNSFCCNPDHIKWESHLYNLSRKGCSGYILIMLKCGKFLMVENEECKHSDRCKNFFSNSPMSVEEVKSLFG